MKKNSFSNWLQDFQSIANVTLEEFLYSSSWKKAPGNLREPISYALLSGGKRIRMALAYLGCQLYCSKSRQSLPAGVAVEMIHAYSLIHDDLPCMDDDSLRRGLPSVHVKFGEGLALLAGDALQALAFEVLSQQEDSVVSQKQIACLSRASGPSGMVGGQSIDISVTAGSADLEIVRKIHAAKTGDLLRSSFLLGVISAGADPKPWISYASLLGALFQATDDLLDMSSTTEQLGKTAGKDIQAGKATLLSALGRQGARKFAENLAREAEQEFARLSRDSLDSPLYNLPHFLLKRLR